MANMGLSMITNLESGTNIGEVAEGIYRINTPVTLPDGGRFNFNQYLLVDERPLLFHTGPKRMFPLVLEAIKAKMPIERLAFVGLSHFEADECGAMDEFLAVAPQALPLCSLVAAMVSVNDVAARPAHAMADRETLVLGEHRVRWIDAPHLPHGWETGYLIEEATGTLLCGDLLTHEDGSKVLTESDILGPSEAFRRRMDYYAYTPRTRALLDRLADLRPQTLACMHGSAWRGDGQELLRSLADSLMASAEARSPQ